MGNISAPELALDDVRVVDLAGPMGQYCTKVLADMGADVIKVERPGGDPARNLDPFVNDEPNSERSLYFYYLNTNKRGITLSLDTRAGREIFKRLVKTADVLVETFNPGYMDNLEMGYSTLSNMNPRLIMVSITGFGQAGPYKDFKAPDIVGVAMGGLMNLGGFPEDPPNYPGAFQGYNLASVDAAIGVLTALFHRDLTGEGQHIDVSMEESVSTAIELAMVSYALRKIIRKRTGRQVYRGWNEVFPCKDGFILCSPLGASGWPRILEWMNSEGMAADLKDKRYKEVLDAMADRQMDRNVSASRIDPRILRDYTQEIRHIEEVWEAFLMTHTREELYEGCQERGVRLMPVQNAKDLVNDPQLIARNFFVDVEHPELGARLKYPGAPYRLSETPWRIAKRAPLIGEHNLEIYVGELGLSSRELAALAGEGTI
ncbi:MAG: CoA transferase [Chloroflexi bacterium]|nr:CoA transferase [Chloroflexota bacterium]